MVRPLGTDSKQELEHQYSDNESVTEFLYWQVTVRRVSSLLWKKTSPSVQGPHMIARSTQSVPTF